MRIKYLLSILFFALIIISKPAAAQEMSLDKIGSVKVNQLSDDQIIKAWQKATDSGLGDKEIYAGLLQKGMPPGEVQSLKDRVTLLGLTSKKNNKTQISKTEKEKIDFTRDKDDTVIMPNLAKRDKLVSQKKLEVYGSEYFNQLDLKFEPNFSVATPKSYVLGPGDEVIVLLTGLNESTVKSVVSPEGMLQVPYAGVVYVNGFTIEQATSLIKAKMTKVYPALKSGQTQVAVNLGNTRRIKVTVIGEANTPGAFTISSLASVFNVLYNSGGPNQNGSLRNIQLIRNNKVYKTLDFYAFLQKGVMDGNIRLEDQDVIRIPVYTKRVGISGEVKRAAIFELKDNETLDDLINYAGGFTDIAYKGVAKIDQINALQREIKDVPANMFSNYTPHNGDLVEIGAVTNRYTNRVVLEGAVYRPGAYELTAGFSLGQLLKSAQGLKPEAYMERGVISRTMPNLEKISLSFNPADIISGKNDIPLLREDSVVIFNRDVFTPNQKIAVQGYVNKPNMFTYRKGIKLADVIAMAGGFANEAADHHVEVSRIIKNESDSVATQLVQTFVVDMTNKSDANQNIELQPMDIVNVPRLVNYRALGNVSIQGEVVFPGEYAVQKRDETAFEFLNRAGGLTPYGSLENVQVYRKGVRVNIDLTNNNTSNTNKILLPSDSIYVPRVISYVEVAGAVNNPQYISYRGRNFKYYINAAAGTTENARIKGAYIKYPDGLNQPVKHFLFFRTYPIVKPGSKIVVPEKSPESKFKLGFGDIGGIATALTALVSVIVVLTRK